MSTEDKPEASPAMQWTEVLREYDALIDCGIQVGRPVGRGDGELQRALGHDLIAALTAREVDVLRIVRDSRDTVVFILRRGAIGQYPGEDGFRINAESAAGQHLRITTDRSRDVQEAVGAYLDEAVPEADIADRLDAERKAKRLEETQALKAKDDAVIAAYEALPEGMRDGLKAMLGYLALAERRDNRGFHRGGPPIANMLLWTLERVERKGMPEFDERDAGRAFHW